MRGGSLFHRITTPLVISFFLSPVAALGLLGNRLIDTRAGGLTLFQFRWHRSLLPFDLRASGKNQEVPSNLNLMNFVRFETYDYARMFPFFPLSLIPETGQSLRTFCDAK